MGLVEEGNKNSENRRKVTGITAIFRTLGKILRIVKLSIETGDEVNK